MEIAFEWKIINKVTSNFPISEVFYNYYYTMSDFWVDFAKNVVNLPSKPDSVFIKVLFKDVSVEQLLSCYSRHIYEQKENHLAERGRSFSYSSDCCRHLRL